MKMHSKYKLDNRKLKLIPCFFCIVLLTSCIKQINLYRGDDENKQENNEGDGKDDGGKQEPQESVYLYPFGKEVRGEVVTEIIIRTNAAFSPSEMTAEIPPVKYNKSLLLMLTQDDCKQSAYCRTWAAINGKPVSNSNPYPTPTVANPNEKKEFYYTSKHLKKGDLPPNTLSASKTMGSTDGTGREVRFSFTTTLAAEESWMDKQIDVKPGFKDNYYRFFMKEGLIWDDVAELINYGAGIAFHDVKTQDVNNVAALLEHYDIAQSIIAEQLSGRKCKTLARPNGNDTYIDAALQYDDIKTITTESNGLDLYPFAVKDDLQKMPLNRFFEENQQRLKSEIREEVLKSATSRKAIHIGVHNTDNAWIDFLRWINDTYGKGGDDSVWMPSQEEYYEYNYYRIHGEVKAESVDENTVKLTLRLPVEENFYYPSVTVNLQGLTQADITAIETDDSVSGLSYANHDGGIMLNIDCRKHLAEHAAHFVEQYEKDKSDATKRADAVYFVSMLKESEKKTELLNRIK